MALSLSLLHFVYQVLVSLSYLTKEGGVNLKGRGNSCALVSFRSPYFEQPLPLEGGGVYVDLRQSVMTTFPVTLVDFLLSLRNWTYAGRDGKPLGGAG